MKSNRIVKLVVLLSLALFLSSGLALAAEVEVVGEVNSNYQLDVNGKIYDIADTEIGDELAENYVNAKVKVVGTLEEDEDMSVITVTSYKVIDE